MINSSLVRKTEKAKDYAMQPQRMKIRQFSLNFQGDNGNHQISYEAGKWSCDCYFFSTHDTCSHIMAITMILQDVELSTVED